MANVKNVFVEGTIPFCILDDAPARLVKVFAMFAAPSWGLRIDYGGWFMVPNRHGGQTATYKFVIRGQEAVSCQGFIDDMALMVKHGAVITEARMVDVENGEDYGIIPDINRRSA